MGIILYIAFGEICSIQGMAYFQYLSQIDSDCLLSSFQHLLEEAGLSISEEFSSHAQIFAEDNNEKSYHSKVKVLISWSDKNLRQCSIEVRSDEPLLKRGTSCERLTSQLRNLIPPHETSI